MMKAIDFIKKDLTMFRRTAVSQKETEQINLQKKAKKLLVVFFALIVVFTLISRAVDSITIAQVITQNPLGSKLTFRADGTGIITANYKKYVKIPEGLSVNKIEIKAGQEIKKGDVLLILDEADINNALNLAEDEVEKLDNQIEQEKLSVTDSYLNEQGKYQLLYNNAGTDFDNSKSDLKTAKALNIDKKSNLSKANATYKKALKDNMDTILKDKLQELTEAQVSYNNVMINNEKSSDLAENALEDAKETLQELANKDSLVQNDLIQYGSTNSDTSQNALGNLLCLAYGDEDAYEKHKDSVIALQKILSRANDDCDTAALKLRNYGINITDNITDKELLKYLESSEEASSYITDFIQSRRAVTDAKDNLAAENKKETVIKTEIANYKYAISNADHIKANSALLKINQCIYGINGYQKHLKELEKAQKSVNQLQSDLNLIKSQNALALSSEQGKLDKIQGNIDALKNGTYDEKDVASEAKQELDTAKQELQTQGQAVKTAERTVETSNNALLIAKNDYEEAIDRDSLNEDNLSKQSAAADLRIKVLRLSIKEKQQTVSDLKQLKENKGKLIAPISGTIDNIAVEAGKKSTIDSFISIGTKSYGITVTVPKEEGEYVSIGNKMVLTQKGKTDHISVKVEGLRFTTDVQGNEIAEITAIMPKGYYIPGSIMDASIINNSELYDICLPIEAIRTDDGASYCLVAKPKNTVLGEELIAEKVKVTIIDKDSTMAAISSSLPKKDNVIISSNKDISVGDRIRARQ